MSERIRARSDVIEWDESESTVNGPHGPATAARVEKRFREGLRGSSSASLLMARYDTGAAYTAIERFTGEMGGRSGEMSFVHGVIHSEAGDEPFGYVVPGSGTGTLAFGHDESGGFVDLELSFQLRG